MIPENIVSLFNYYRIEFLLCVYVNIIQLKSQTPTSMTFVFILFFSFGTSFRPFLYKLLHFGFSFYRYIIKKSGKIS